MMIFSGPDDSHAEAAPAIQPHGWILICDVQASTVIGHSANLPGLMPQRDVILGLALRDLLGSDASHALRNALSRASITPRPSLLPARPIAGCDGLYDFSVHSAGEETIIEIEPAAPPDPTALDRARALVDRLAATRELDKLLLITARLVFSLLQWDCVTVLRFAPDGAARVLARQKRADWPDAGQDAAALAPFSAEARAFYRAARLRFLADAGASPSPIVGAPLADLTRAHLRAATADERARAMKAGFASLLSLPIIVEGELWGLLLAHDRERRSLTMDERAVFDLFADFLSLSVQSALWREAADGRRLHTL